MQIIHAIFAGLVIRDGSGYAVFGLRLSPISRGGSREVEIPVTQSEIG
jgi:hypothetical protein